MSRFLMIDIGAGTMDLLWYDSQTREHFKAVAPSPVRTIADDINQSRGPSGGHRRGDGRRPGH